MRNNSRGRTLYTIGFTRKSAAEFFTLLKEAQVRQVLDVRLQNTSQLAGFAKRDDLIFFLDAILGASYRHLPEFAPSKDILVDFKKGAIDWGTYEARYKALITQRNAVNALKHCDLDHACLLCSEHEPQQCHRSLAAEHIRQALGPLAIAHL